MDEINFIRGIQPLYKIIIVSLIGLYTLLTAYCRINLTLGSKLFSHDDWQSSGHLFNYTILPGIVFICSLALLIIDWDSTEPLIIINGIIDIFQPIIISLSFFVIIIGSYLRKNKFTGDKPSELKNWIPFLITISGILLLFIGVLLKQ